MPKLHKQQHRAENVNELNVRPQQFIQLFNEQSDSLKSEYSRCLMLRLARWLRYIFVVYWCGIYVKWKQTAKCCRDGKQKPVVGRHAF